MSKTNCSITCQYCYDGFLTTGGYIRHLQASPLCNPQYQHVIGKSFPKQKENFKITSTKKQKIDDNSNANKFIYPINNINLKKTKPTQFIPAWNFGILDHHLQPFLNNTNDTDLYFIETNISDTIHEMNLCNPESLLEYNYPTYNEVVNYIQGDNTIKESIILDKDDASSYYNTSTNKHNIKTNETDWSPQVNNTTTYYNRLYYDYTSGMKSLAELFALELFQMLLKADSPNYLYDDIMGLINKYVLNQISYIPSTFSTRANIVKHFSQRFNMDMLKPQLTHITFKSKKFPVVKFDAETMVMSLLQDKYQLFTDSNLIFPTKDGNPFGELDNEPDILDDINTSKILLQSHIRLQQDPTKDLPIGLLFYMDKIVIDKHGHISVEPLQFTLSIFNRKTRNQPYSWRPFGYVPNIGLHSKAESKHLFKAEDKALLTHLILEQILKQYKQLEDNGISNYQFVYRGKQYTANLKFYVLVILGDTEAHDKLCGHYNCRNLGVKCICRHCKVPSDQLDNPWAMYPLTEQSSIDQWVANNDIENLNNMSQYNFPTVWKTLNITFGGNVRGIHGVTPSEPLHMIDLGIFKYLVQVFFDDMGPKDCKLHSLIDSWAKRVGRHLQHQSDKQLPKTYFPNGISGSTKLNGHEYVGVVLVLTLLLQMDGPQNTIINTYNIPSATIHRWSKLFELCVCWRKWLQKGECSKDEIIKSKQGHVKLLETINKVAKRQEGNGWKVVKFHMITHIQGNLLDFASALNIDTSAPESNHKYNVKKPATHTQTRASTLEIQTATRYYENLIVNYAAQRLLPKLKQPKTNNVMRGARFQLLLQQITSDANNVTTKTIELMWKSESMEVSYHSKYINWLGTHLFSAFGFNDNVIIEGCTEYHRNQLIFRGHPNYNSQGGWYDWALFQWLDNTNNYINVPAQIVMFLYLPSFESKPLILDKRMSIKEEGLYALVESCYHPMKPISSSNRLYEKKDKAAITMRGRKETKHISDKCLYLVHVDTINDALAAVPNLGNTNFEFIVLHPSTQWHNGFTNFIEDNAS